MRMHQCGKEKGRNWTGDRGMSRVATRIRVAYLRAIRRSINGLGSHDHGPAFMNVIMAFFKNQVKEATTT